MRFAGQHKRVKTADTSTVAEAALNHVRLDAEAVCMSDPSVAQRSMHPVPRSHVERLVIVCLAGDGVRIR